MLEPEPTAHHIRIEQVVGSRQRDRAADHRARGRNGDRRRVFLEVGPVYEGDGRECPGRMPRPGELRRVVRLVGDVERVCGLCELQFEKLGFRVARGDLIGGTGRHYLPAVLVKADIEVPEFQDIGLRRREFEPDQPALAVVVLGRGDEVRPRALSRPAVRQRDHVFELAASRIILCMIRPTIQKRAQFPGVETRNQRVCSRHGFLFNGRAEGRREPQPGRAAGEGERVISARPPAGSA
ncbi:MAG: hypothetical protein A4E73_00394 [Syntrophaceae bacterium PtaU1.Bin231]|nr:MAG: hypothetical protein A4E73_00394 [Syntrophaceae bacterium PtaU1.Bin231]